MTENDGVANMFGELISEIGKGLSQMMDAMMKSRRPKTVFVSRKFDKDSGSGVWKIAEEFTVKLLNQHIYDDVKLIRQNNDRSSKLFHDLVKVPFLCLYYRIRGFKDYYFFHENQALVVPILNMFGGRSIVLFHDLMRVKGKLTDRRKLRDILDYLYYKIVYFAASKSPEIVFNSSKTEKEFFDRFKRREGTSYGRFDPILTKYDSRRKDDPRIRHDVIGYIGSFSERKRVTKLVELAEAIKNGGFDYKVEAWGTGPRFNEIKGLVNDKGLNDYIMLKGYLDEKDKEKVLKSFGVFFFPTEEEGYGIPIAEAFMCNVPVYTLKDANIPDEVREMSIPVENVSELLADVKLNEIRRAKVYG